MSYDDDQAKARIRRYEETGRTVIPWECIAILAPPPTSDETARITAQDIVTLNGGAWYAWWHPVGVPIPEQVTGLVLRERAWYGARGVEPPFHPWQRLVP